MQSCLNSWKVLNPHYTVRVVHESTLINYFDAATIKALLRVKSSQSQSDLVRVNLLSLYGGVYVDFDVFATKPLETWLPQLLSPTGFFTFALQGRDRPVVSWFLASKRNNTIITKWRDRIMAHAERHNGSFGRYFQFHYEFADALRDDSTFASLWAQTPRISNSNTGTKEKAPYRYQQIFCIKSMQFQYFRGTQDI